MAKNLAKNNKRIRYCSGFSAKANKYFAALRHLNWTLNRCNPFFDSRYFFCRFCPLLDAQTHFIPYGIRFRLFSIPRLYKLWFNDRSLTVGDSLHFSNLFCMLSSSVCLRHRTDWNALYHRFYGMFYFVSDISVGEFYRFSSQWAFQWLLKLISMPKWMVYAFRGARHFCTVRM